MARGTRIYFTVTPWWEALSFFFHFLFDVDDSVILSSTVARFTHPPLDMLPQEMGIHPRDQSGKRLHPFFLRHQPPCDPLPSGRDGAEGDPQPSSPFAGLL